MAGTKRLRSGSKGTAAASDSDPSLMLLFDHIKEIALSSERSIAVLQDFCDSKCSLEPPKRNAQALSVDCNSILLATHILKRLLHSSSTNFSLISTLGCLVSKVLVSDAQKLERASHVSSSRPILAYALLTATVASLHCLEQYETGKNVSACDVETCISTLHRLVFLKPHGEEGEDTDWNLDNDNAATELSSAEEKCISILLLHTTEGGKEEKKATPSKRKTRRKSNPSSSSHSDTDEWFTALEEMKASDSMYSQRLDARTAIKRWASAALVWECQGQLLLLQVSHKLAKQPQFASCSARSEWMNDLVQIVTESGLHCGLRPPTGHVDQLFKIIHPSASKSSSKSGSKKKSKPVRADIRDWTAVAIYDLLDIHRMCLKNVTSTSFTSSVVVNDMGAASVTSIAPELSSNLVHLCSAASNSAFTTDQGMRASWAKSLVDLFTACAFRLAVDPDLPLDCSLSDVAISQVATILENAIGAESSPLNEETSLEEIHDLLQPLPEPNIKKIDTNYTSPGRSCTYAGLNESIPFDKPSEDSSVAIVIRAIWTEAADSGNQDATPSGQLVRTLTSILARLYDTREVTEDDDVNDIAEFVEDSGSKSKKRNARSSGRASKRRKTKQQPVKPMDGTWRRISISRVEVATETLKALKFCLLNQSIPTSQLRQAIRKSLGLEHFMKLLDLGPLLDRILIRTQEPVKMDIDGSFAFSKAEQELWAAHMEMCQYLGRGRSYDSGFMIHPILGTHTQRKGLYQGIAKDGNFGWSLSLPAAHQTLLIANLTSERKATTRSLTVPELYIAKEYVKSIHRTMQTVQTLTKRELDDDHIYVETDLLLSYNDARVFVLAFCRLLKDDQLAVLRDLVTQTEKDLNSILSNSTRRSLLSGNNEASGFVARVLVVCGCLLDVATIGSRLEKLIFANNGGQAKVSFPSFVSTMEWYTSDRCFMSIFDWESPMLPDPSLPQRSLSGLDSSVVDAMQMALEHAFELGFESARQDKCHLLFSSWNMMDKVNAITDYVVQRQGLRTTAFPSLQASLEGSLASRFLELREDMAKLHSESDNDDSFRFNANRLRTSLRTMLTRANALVEMILANHVPEDELMSQATPLLVFGLLEALSTYISAAIALHTKPGNDYFSVSPEQAGTRSARNRGDSSESEHVASDADSIDSDGDGDMDARSETLDQLRRCCYTFGAAPIHPDWLDVSCSLRNGIRHEDATGAALDALRGLTRLALTAYLQYRKHSSSAMKEQFGGTSADHDDRVSLCIRLCNWANKENSKDASHRDDVDWKDSLAALFGVPQQVTEVLLGNLSVKNLEEVRAAWCPNCTQQEDDKLQDRWLNEDGTWDAPTSELRACGEWRLLLAQSLTTSCLDVQYGSPYHTKSGAARFAGHSGHEDMVAALLWRNVMATAISSLMPAAALLRVGLGRTGRKPHPFCFQAKKSTAEDIAPIDLTEELPRTVTTSSSQKAAVFDAISLLSHLSVQVDQELATQCQAVASHLLTESKSFADLVAVQSMVSAVGDLQAAQALKGTEGKENERLKSISLVTELLSCAIFRSCRVSPGPDVSGGYLGLENNGRLMTLLGASQKGFYVDTIVQKKIEPLHAFVQSKKLEPIDAMHSPKKDLKVVVIEELVRILCRDRYSASDQSRTYAGNLLSTAASLDFFPDQTLESLKIVPALISSFNKVNKQKMTSLVIKDLCCLTKNRVVEPRSSSLSFRKSIANILCFLQLSPDEGGGFKSSKLVFDKLDGGIEAWSSLDYDDRAPVIEVLLLYACRFKGLQDVGSKLVRQAVSNIDESSKLSISSSEMKALSNLFAYARRLRKSLIHEKTKEVQLQRASQHSKANAPWEVPTIAKGLKLPLACSYIQESGFRTQHWYNCYTCGLVWDKGCCTLCALTCHRGHDVSYSRCSSFFCDCGAENNNPGEQIRVSCKCGSPVTRDQTLDFLKDDWLSYETLDKMSPTAEEGRPFKAAEYYGTPSTLAIVQAAFRETGLASLRTLTSAALEATWHNDLFRILKSQFRSWQQTRSFESRLSIYEQEPSGNLEAKPMIRSSQTTLRGSLRTRRSRVLSLHQLPSHSLIPVRRAVGFQTKMASDNPTNSHLRLKLESGEIFRSILVADSRGRMVLAEPCTLVFFSTIPSVNVRNVARPLGEAMTRQQMCILGLGLLKFNVIGMQLCPDNERHLVVWGLTEACVVVVKSDWTGIDDTINLVFDIGQRDSDDGNHLVKCEWIPGSESNVVVGCSRFVRIYDVAKTKSGSRALPVVGYNLGFEANLRDVTMVASPCITDVPRMSKMFLLLENGRLHVVDLKSGEDGRLESPSDQQRFEPSECVSLSMSGIRSRSGIGAPGSATRTLGEGSRLAYLKQSRTLLYKCSTSCVVALVFDKKGAVDGTFEFLPHVISADVLGDISDNTSVSGPYTHWTELGLAYRNGAAFFRVSCIGRSVNSKTPKLLCIEFNENESRVGLLSWSPRDDDDLDLMQSESFAGLAAFSTPFISNTDGPMYGERAFLGAVSSSGTLFFFGEKCIDSLPISEEVSAQSTIHMVDASGSAFEKQAKKKPAFPLTIFETLQNIGDSASVIFGGRGIGSGGDELKARLSRDSGQSFVCPNRNGCTITVSLRDKEASDTSNSSAFVHEKDASSGGQLVIAAVRILVGSSFGGIPSRVVIQGRPLDLTPRAKKWYCLPLTKEEIALGVRSGFISVGIERPFDSSSSIVIDAMEVYGIERESLEQWLPKSYASTDLSTARRPPNVLQEQEIDGETDESTSLIHSCQALSNLFEVSGGRRSILNDEREFLRELVEETALDTCNRVRDSVQNLLKNLEPDTRSRTSFLDECILLGCARTVSMSRSSLEASAMESGDDLLAEKTYQQKAIGSLIRDSLQAASRIANERPMNYLKTMENAIESDLSSASLAVEASKLLIVHFAEVEEYQDMINGSEGIIELSLIELAIELNTDSAHSEQFASFTTIRNFLDMGNADFVKRTCDAISHFCSKHGKTDPNGLFTLIQQARLVAYQCDSCALFPMKTIRFTLLEGDHDIDLCQACYSLGKEYAESNNFDASVEVKINGKSVGAEPKLDCAQMNQMQPVSLTRMDVELVEVSSNNPKGAKPSDDQMEVDNGQSVNTQRPKSNESNGGTGCQAFEDFLGFLFKSIADHVSSKLKKQETGSEIAPIFGLLLEIVQLSQQGDAQNNRAKRFAKELCIGLSYLLRTPANRESSQHNMLPSILCLRALSSLLAPENYASYSLDWSQPDDVLETARLSKQKEKTNPNYVCPVHKIPAVRRRCNSGANKDRRFYVCGMERGKRCKYFVWADESSIGKPEDRKRDQSPIYEIIRSNLWSESKDVGISLQERLCQILEQVLFDGEDNDSASPGSSSKKKERLRLGSTYSHENRQKDFADGVFCSREKLRDIISVNTELENSQNSFSSDLISGKRSGDQNMRLLESSLDLLVLVADHKTKGISRWFSLLCEIIVSKTKHASIRPMAKKVLKHLCGGKMTLFQTIRDHFGFWFQLKRLYRCSITRLEAALIVKEKSRYCHPNWSNLEKKTWANLCVGDLIGTDELLSEDTYSHVSSKLVGRVLDDLWNGIKSRDDSWRRFCGLRSLPQSLRDQRKKSNADTQTTHNDHYLSEAAPIMALFWISCALSGTNQTKALRILDFALNESSDGSRTDGTSNENATGNDESSAKEEEEEDMISLSQEGRALPEEILMTGKEKLTVDGFVAFSMTYVYGGRTSQLRQAAAGILKKLSNSLSTEEQGQVFHRLVYTPMEDVGRMGKASNEFLGFLQSLSSSIGSDVPRDAADLVLDCFEQQIEAARYDRSNGEWVVLESNAASTPVKKRFDISPCLHCQRQHSPGKDSFALLGERTDSGASGTGRNTRSGMSASSRAQPPSRTHDQRKWHKDQVAAFSRGRIDSSKESSSSNEFCSFFLLKYRLSISEIHLSVNDPRGRYVKTINVYFSPRPVNAVSELKAEDYTPRWKKCATMNLSRGALRASATFQEPLVACNLKVEYAEFYERPGGSKAADGSFVVHCPRCTRVVTNAHGVCGNCGEVAFQCRKCRHINYDRLDAFLCVECGYCASGTFSYELSAGVASNAVTITNDEDRERAMRMMGTVISIENDIRSAIREKVSIIGRKKTTNSSIKKNDSEQGFNSSMKMAFLGVPSSSTLQDHNKVFDRVEKPGSVVKYVARPNSAPLASRGGGAGGVGGSSSSTVDRTRSLLRLARQIRSESGYPSGAERRRSGDVIIRHLGRGLAIDHMEEDNDLLGLLEDDGLDSADSLSRALAASSRRRGLGGLASSEGGVDGGGEPPSSSRNENAPTLALAKKKEAGKEAVMEFLKLHSLLREAEREKNELSRRLLAWDGLCRGFIGQVDTESNTHGEIDFAPSHCSACSVPVAQQLLTLWLRLFQASPATVSVDLDFICTLLEEMPGIGKGFLEFKRMVVREVATKSPVGAKLVLSELRKRLEVSRDMNCAEILGKILESEEFDFADDFSQLAMDVLAR